MHWLGFLLGNYLGSALAKILVGGGLALGTYAVAKPMIMSALYQASQSLNNMGGDILAVALIAGIGEVMSILGSAIATRLLVTAARVTLRRRS